MKNYSLKNAFKQRGMTLIELTIVLLILIGLAGLLLPYVGGFQEKTQNSSTADSLAEVNKAIGRFEAQFNGAFPDKFDSLYDGTGVINWLAGANGAVPGVLTTCPLTANEVTSLKAAEIDSLYNMAAQTAGVFPDGFNATFNGNATTNGTLNAPVTIAATTNVVCLTHDATTGGIKTILADKMGIEVDADDLSATATDHENEFVVFGVGARTQMQGKVMTEAPVYFSSGNDNPALRYARFLAVFKVAKDGSRASYVGALTPDLKTSSDFLASAHSGMADND